MGGERASTIRARLAGKMCCSCKALLELPYLGREAYCRACEKRLQQKHKVYCHFVTTPQGWRFQFFASDLKTPLARKLTLRDEGRVWELARRGGASMMLEDKHALEAALQTGRGSMWLYLTADQYAKLRGRS